MRELHGGNIEAYPNVKADFSANLNPMAMPNAVRSALQNSLRHCEHYPDPDCRHLRIALTHREQCPIEWIICGSGAVDLIYRIAMAFRPQKAVIPVPTFSEYAAAFRGVGCQVEEVVLTEENDFLLTESILEKITDDTDCFVLCNPNNPTGRLVEAGLLQEIVNRCEATNTMLLVDESFLDFTAAKSATQYLETSSHLIVIKSFTKLYNLAGIRLGYCLTSNPQWQEKIYDAGQPWSVSIPAQAAGTAAASEVIFCKQSRSLVERERKKLAEFLTEEGVKVFPSEANFLLFYTERDLVEPLLEEGILIRDCSNFVGLGKGYYRIAVRTPEENKLFCRAWRIIR